jgi:hypothetical protein
VGCGEPATTTAPTTPTAHTAPPASARPPAFDEAAWGKFHSKRFQLTLPLPEGRAWKIDDHAKRELVATHPPTTSRLTVYAWYDTELMNHAKCEARARGEGLVPKGELKTVDSEITVGPDAFDSRIWVAADSPEKNGAKQPLNGHLFLFGAFIRRCLFVHLETQVPSRDDEDVLSNRLAVARVRLLGGLKLDPPRTMEDSDVPREKPAGTP